jgi:hypothetical protein
MATAYVLWGTPIEGVSHDIYKRYRTSFERRNKLDDKIKICYEELQTDGNWRSVLELYRIRAFSV